MRHLFPLCMFLPFLVCSQMIYKNDTSFTPDEESPCLRPCTSSTKPMECNYKFVVENYQILSRACYDCPSNQDDCFRPHCVPADGTSRSIITVNRRMPGPPIQVCEGDTIVVLVENHLATEETTIHWHGHHMVHTPHMDGVPLLTQCPISAGTSFQYRFKAEHPGTLFWHTHSGNQRGDGVFGAFVTRQTKERDPHSALYDFDLPEHTVVIVDWNHSPAHNVFVRCHHNSDLPEVEAILVNGLGYIAKSKSKTRVPPAKFSVTKGYRYRFRIINAEVFMCPTEISVDNHTISIISLDGHDVEPFAVTSFVIYAGERFDFILNTDQEIDNYWIRFRGKLKCEETKVHQVAILSYSGADNSFPKGEPSYDFQRKDGLQLNPVNEDMLKEKSVKILELNTLLPNDLSLTKKPDKKFYLHFDFYPIHNTNFFVKGLYEYNENNPLFQSESPQINHISFAFQSSPLYSQRDEINPEALCNETTVKDCSHKFCQCTHVLQVALNDVVEVVLIDIGKLTDANHPFHLHGYAFRLVGMDKIGKSVTLKEIKELDELGLLKRKLDRAPLKDTVTVPDGGYSIFRFHATNPGYWLFHCHIDFHATAGMALVFKVGEHEEMPPIPDNFPKCGNWRL